MAFALAGASSEDWEELEFEIGGALPPTTEADAPGGGSCSLAFSFSSSPFPPLFVDRSKSDKLGSDSSGELFVLFGAGVFGTAPSLACAVPVTEADAPGGVASALGGVVVVDCGTEPTTLNDPKSLGGALGRSSCGDGPVNASCGPRRGVGGLAASSGNRQSTNAAALLTDDALMFSLLGIAGTFGVGGCCGGGSSL